MQRILLFAVAVPLFSADVPRTWTDEAVARLEVPLANPKYSAIHVSEQEYYRLPERTIYRTYPVYHPSREPAGYMEKLKQLDPQSGFDPAELKSKDDWIRAGERVFRSPVSFGPVFFSAQDVRDADFYTQTGMPVAADGTIPFAVWVIRKKGQVELGSMGCSTCHTRVLPGGVVVAGAQGNNPGDRQGARMLRMAAAAADPGQVLARVRKFALQFEVPWVTGDPNQRARTMSLEELIQAGEAIPPGVTARSHTSMVLPPQIPDLIGVKERRFLDHTGLVRQREIADLMRYSALVQDTIGLARHGESDPAIAPRGSRYSDAQLYALALYLYSLQPPPNPNSFDALAAAGKTVFERENCGGCHTPPLYTNNKLIPVEGFERSGGKPDPDVLAKPVGTDPRYALQTLKGTGYYKVPSLKGVWYRGPFEHHGSVVTLEDWFDAGRLRPDYVPTGYKGFDGSARSVKGHAFGLRLGAEDKRALIAFLKTL